MSILWTAVNKFAIDFHAMLNFSVLPNIVSFFPKAQQYSRSLKEKSEAIVNDGN